MYAMLYAFMFGAAVFIGLNVFTFRSGLFFILFPLLLVFFYARFHLESAHTAFPDHRGLVWFLSAGISLLLSLLLFFRLTSSGRYGKTLRFLGGLFLLLLPGTLILNLAEARRLQGPGLPGAKSPNILLVILDTTRADHLSPWGYARKTAPVLADLAADSTVFTRAYSPSPWTAPSHASLFTGLHPRRHGATLKHIGKHFSSRYLSDDFPTLAEIFGSAGYQTASFSSNIHVHRRTGITRGFKEDRYSSQYSVQRPAVAALLEKGTRFITGNDVSNRASYRGADLILRWWRRNDTGDRPWFVFVNFSDPHLDYDPPDSTLRTSVPEAAHHPKEKLSTLSSRFSHSLALCPWGSFMEAGEREIVEYLYDGEIFFADRQVGRLIQFLRDRDRMDRTVIIVAADHGEGLGDHGWLGHMYQLYDTLLHVPLLIRYPDLFPPNSRCEEMVSLCDLFPTLTRVTGVPAPDDSFRYGLDLSKLLTDGKGRDHVISEHHIPGWYAEKLFRLYPETPHGLFHGSIYSVTTQNWKLILYPDGEKALYRLDLDPAETNDVSDLHAARVEEMTGIWETWMDATPEYDPPLDRQEMSEEVRRQLRALGYL